MESIKILFRHERRHISHWTFVRSGQLTMKTCIYLIALCVLTICNLTFPQNFVTGLRFRFPTPDESWNSYRGNLGNLPSNDADGMFLNTHELYREDRGLIAEPQPLCKEVRTELPSWMYIPLLQNADTYTFRPQKIYIVNCSREDSGREFGTAGGCWPQHCREKYVDIDIFGKPKTLTENLWQLMMEIPSVPIACECFRMP